MDPVIDELHEIVLRAFPGCRVEAAPDGDLAFADPPGPGRNRTRISRPAKGQRREGHHRAPRAARHHARRARLRAALADLWPWRQENADALRHGDYWPGNVVFNDGKLVAVLDWEEPEVGDPLADVALARLDLWAFGEEAMHTFTRFYRERTELDWQHLARWDLVIALRPVSNLHRWAESYPPPPISRPEVTELSMREGHRRFVRQALESLGRS